MNHIDNWDTDELVALAAVDIDSGRLDTALSKLKRVLGGEHPPAEAIAMAARLYAQLKLFGRAEALFRRCVEADADAVTERFQLGMSLFDAGKSAEALVVWETLLGRHPDYPPALFYRGLVMAQSGEVDNAHRQFEDLLRRVPADNLYFSRAQGVLRELGRTHAQVKGDSELDPLPGMNLDAYKTIQ